MNAPDAMNYSPYRAASNVDDTCHFCGERVKPLELVINFNEEEIAHLACSDAAADGLLEVA